MNIEDLIIGKKYQHIRNESFAFYAGKNQYGSPVFELEKTDGTYVTLPPNYKFIASNTYWAYTGLEREFSECDPKSDYLFNIGDEFIVEKDSDDDNLSWVKDDIIKVIERSKIPFEPNQSSSKAYYKWTNLNNGKTFVSTEDCRLCQTMKPITVEPSTSKTPEYVECTRSKNNEYTVGKIYKVEKGRKIKTNEGYLGMQSLPNNLLNHYDNADFKPSTKEAYDLQQSGGKIEEFDVDDWVYHTGNNTIYQISQILPNNRFKAYSGYACDTGNLSLDFCVKATAEEISKVSSNSNNLSSLPEKWGIKRDNINDKIVTDYINKEYRGYHSYFSYNPYCPYLHSKPGVSSHVTLYPDYTEITFEQFKKWVLKEKPVDNQLSNKETSNYGSSPFYWQSIDPIPPFKRSSKEDLEFQLPVIVKTSKNKKSKLVII